MKYSRFILLFIIFVLNSMIHPNTTAQENIDFSRPADVRNQALASIKEACKSHQSSKAIIAFANYSKACNLISDDYTPEVLKTLQEIQNAETKPDYKALLHLIEADVYTGLKRNAKYNNEVHDSYPEDITEWNNLDFTRKISELYAKALADKKMLISHKVTEYSDLIRYNGDMVKFFPTLLDFCYIKLKEQDLPDFSQEDILSEWESLHKKDVAPTIFIKSLKCNDMEDLVSSWHWERNWFNPTANDDNNYMLDLYNQYSKHEESGLILSLMSPEEKQYDIYQDYIKRFPSSIFNSAIQNHIAIIETNSLDITFPNLVHSNSKLKVKFTFKNTSKFKLSVYKVNNRKDTTLDKLEFIEEIPFFKSQEKSLKEKTHYINLGPFPYGRYIIVPSIYANGKEYFHNGITDKSKVNSRYYSSFAVTDLATLIISEENNCAAFALDGESGFPVEKANLIDDDNKTVGASDSTGCVKLLNIRYHWDLYRFTKGRDKYSDSETFHPLSIYKNTRYHASIITDLAIYRPGETVKYSAVLYKLNSDIHEVCPNEKVTAKFYDSNNKVIASDSLKADMFGRLNGEFTIPTDRMNGNFYITINCGGDSFTESIEVSEYKAPTFDISTTNALHCYNSGEDVAISGSANTFSGMPIAGAEVKYSLTRRPYFWWLDDDESNDVINDTITTNQQGEFTINLPKHLFKENEGKCIPYIYQLSITCTNSTGESQATTHSFSVGKHRGIKLGEDLTFINSGKISLPVIIDSSDEKDKDFTCQFSITDCENNENILASGKITASNTEVDLTSIPSGTYNITVSDENGIAEDASGKITLFKPTDKSCPVDTALWVPKCAQRVDANNIAHVILGTSHNKANVHYIATSKTKIISQGWIEIDKGLNSFSVPMPEGENETLTLNFFTIKDFESYSETFTLTSPINTRKHSIEIISFRDKISPASKESWKFRVVDNNGKPLSGAAILALTDKAIHSIVPNNWPAFSTAHSLNLFRLSSTDISTNHGDVYWRPKAKSTDNLSTDIDFSLQLFAYRYSRHQRFKGSIRLNSLYEEEVCYDAAPCVAYGSSGAMEQEQEFYTDAENEIKIPDDISIREGEIKTALWMPNITVDKDGYFTVEFETPNYNTTWILQALAFDKELHNAFLSKEIVSSKPIMVKANMPRFLRAGDKAVLAASVANKNDEATSFSSVIELFDPRTGDIISTKTVNGSLAAAGSTPVNIDFNVPADMPYIGFRVKAANGNFSDGEQVIVPILSDYSPVIETEPFFIDANKDKFTANLPAPRKEAKITFEYCDNPVWYCATSLPTIYNEDAHTSTSLAHSLFALAVAEGIAKENPQILEALNEWKSQDNNSALTSQLAKNSDLKIGTLLASPWINEAERQSMQMSHLHELFNSDSNSEKLNAIINRIASLQQGDGGFAWIHYNGCKSSIFATSAILELIGEINALGYLKNHSKLNKMAEKAISYFDKEYLKAFKEAQKNNAKRYDNFSTYAYIRTLFAQVSMQKENQKFYNLIIADMEKNWKEYPLSEKAFSAITLNRNSKQKVAKDITESIRQHSISHPSKGMYWDRIGYSYRNNSKLAVTAVILQALNEVDGRDDEIDQIRKWILLNKQTNNWGGSSLAADAVYSILCTGSKWLSKGFVPDIQIGGTPIVLTEIESHLGYARKEITIDASNGCDVTINRHQCVSPAWGAVYSQYSAPMTEIKAAKVDELSIEKKYLVYGDDGKLRQATELKVGDKVSIQCTIKCGKEMEYVTLCDERGACFEPTDKVSTYSYIDGIWHYREIKDSSTNIFIPHLPKGTHVINYDAYVTNPGTFSIGIATIQCQYAPQFTAHSAGATISVK